MRERNTVLSITESNKENARRQEMVVIVNKMAVGKNIGSGRIRTAAGKDVHEMQEEAVRKNEKGARGQ